MSAVAVAALAGYGCAVLLAWASARIERWWEPKWSVTVRAFAVYRERPPVAAVLGAAAYLVSDGSLVAAAASATAAWLIAQGYVLLLLSARR